jgi:hypothetical protein
MTERHDETMQNQSEGSTQPADEEERGQGRETGGEQAPSESAQAGGNEEGEGRQPEAVASDAVPHAAPASLDDPGGSDERAPLLAGDEAERFRQRWEALQAGFVDHPRQIVEQAEDLVGELMQELTTGFSDKRSELEQQWDRGGQVSTEELRVTLTRYRSFFNRLLSA